MKIYLIGMPLSGKTHLALKLAEALNYEFIDMDQEITDNHNMSIDAIFYLYGESTFRTYETELLEALKERDNIVVSTGGGIVTTPLNKKHFDGITFYLDTSLEELENRLKMSHSRPLLKVKTIKELYEERKDAYLEFSDHIIKNDSDFDKPLKQIIKILNDGNHL